ncbi:hypothetical protein diail_1333, partial [Diaporthe ilicicola]
LARHGRRLLQLLDDPAVVPGDERQPYTHGAQARQILNDAEDDIREWQPEPEDQQLGSPHQHETAHGQKEPVQLESPTMSSGGELSPRDATHGGGGGIAQNISGSTGGDVADTTSTAHPQGEPASAKRREGGGGGGDRVYGRVYRHRRGASDTEIEPQSPQQQLEGSTMIAAGSPVSSVGGWRDNNDNKRRVRLMSSISSPILAMKGQSRS